MKPVVPLKFVKRRSGITLIEMLTVFAIIVILFVVIVGMVAGTGRQTYQSATCQGGCSCRMSR